MSELKKVILKEIEELTLSGLDRSNAIDIVTKKHYVEYYKEAIELKSELGIGYEEESDQIKNIQNGNTK